MKRIVAGVLLMATAPLLWAGSATAAPKPSDKVKTANPAQACAFVTTYTEGSFSECVDALSSGSDPLYQAALNGGCVDLETGSPELPAITWPYTFYEGEEMPPGWPRLRAHDREQCAIALFTFHTLAPYFFPE